MGGSGMEGSGSGYGMGGYGYGMGGSGYGGEWSEWKPTGGYGGGECCPTKKIWGSMNPEKDGFYDLVVDENMMQNMMVRNPSMFPNGKVMDLDMATGRDLEWVLDPAWTMETCNHHTDGTLE